MILWLEEARWRSTLTVQQQLAERERKFDTLLRTRKTLNAVALGGVIAGAVCLVGVGAGAIFTKGNDTVQLADALRKDRENLSNFNSSGTPGSAPSSILTSLQGQAFRSSRSR